MKEIKAVLFDLGGTLVKVPDPWPVIESFLEEKGISKTEDEISRAVQKAESSFGPDYYVTSSFWKEWNLRVLENLGIVSRRLQLANYIDSHWFDRLQAEPFKDAEDVLKELVENDIQAGVVTNALSSDLPHLVGETGLEDYLDTTTTADEAGRRKPNHRIFLRAARQLEIPPSAILFVGDDVELDYRPSEEVGMKPLLINRVGEEVLVPHVIDDLRDLISHL